MGGFLGNDDGAISSAWSATFTGVRRGSFSAGVVQQVVSGGHGRTLESRRRHMERVRGGLQIDVADTSVIPRVCVLARSPPSDTKRRGIPLFTPASGPLPAGTVATTVASQIGWPVLAFDTVSIRGDGSFAKPQSPPPQRGQNHRSAAAPSSATNTRANTPPRHRARSQAALAPRQLCWRSPTQQRSRSSAVRWHHATARAARAATTPIGTHGLREAGGDAARSPGAAQVRFVSWDLPPRRARAADHSMSARWVSCIAVRVSRTSSLADLQMNGRPVQETFARHHSQPCSKLQVRSKGLNRCPADTDRCRCSATKAAATKLWERPSTSSDRAELSRSECRSTWTGRGTWPRSGGAGVEERVGITAARGGLAGTSLAADVRVRVSGLAGRGGPGDRRMIHGLELRRRTGVARIELPAATGGDPSETHRDEKPPHDRESTSPSSPSPPLGLGLDRACRTSPRFQVVVQVARRRDCWSAEIATMRTKKNKTKGKAKKAASRAAAPRMPTKTATENGEDEVRRADEGAGASEVGAQEEPKTKTRSARSRPKKRSSAARKAPAKKVVAKKLGANKAPHAGQAGPRVEDDRRPDDRGPQPRLKLRLRRPWSRLPRWYRLRSTYPERPSTKSCGSRGSTTTSNQVSISGASIR